MVNNTFFRWPIPLFGPMILGPMVGYTVILSAFERNDDTFVLKVMFEGDILLMVQISSDDVFWNLVNSGRSTTQLPLSGLNFPDFWTINSMAYSIQTTEQTSRRRVVASALRNEITGRKKSARLLDDHIFSLRSFQPAGWIFCMCCVCCVCVFVLRDELKDIARKSWVMYGNFGWFSL